MRQLTPEEEVKVRHHLGYLNVQEASTFFLGVPAGVETQFQIEGALVRILPQAVPLIRQLICKCDEAECLRAETTPDRVTAKQVGDIVLAGKEGADAVIRDYQYWRQALANAVGSYANPFDARDDLRNGLNVPVTG